MEFLQSFLSFFLFEKEEIFFGEPFLSVKQKKSFKKKILKIELLIDRYTVQKRKIFFGEPFLSVKQIKNF